MSDRFWSKVDQSNADGCWPWTAAITSAGYGTYWTGKDSDCPRLVLAHREAYERTVGPIPAGHDIDHLCRNRRCVNPAHMEPVTRAENVRRGDGPRLAAERAAMITHCPQGHEYDEQNTLITPAGSRSCRACRRASSRRHYHKRKGN